MLIFHFSVWRVVIFFIDHLDITICIMEVACVRYVSTMWLLWLLYGEFRYFFLRSIIHCQCLLNIGESWNKYFQCIISFISKLPVFKFITSHGCTDWQSERSGAAPAMLNHYRREAYVTVVGFPRVNMQAYLWPWRNHIKSNLHTP